MKDGMELTNVFVDLFLQMVWIFQWIGTPPPFTGVSKSLSEEWEISRALLPSFGALKDFTCLGLSLAPYDPYYITIAFLFGFSVIN